MHIEFWFTMEGWWGGTHLDMHSQEKLKGSKYFKLCPEGLPRIINFNDSRGTYTQAEVSSQVRDIS